MRQSILALEELLFRLVVVPLVAFLPAPLAYGLACWRGDWRYRHDAARRERIVYNLARVLGARLTPAEQTHVARDFFRRRSCEALDEMRLAGSGRALKRLVEIRGLEHIATALASGKGAMVCSAHAGSYNACFSLLGTCGFSVTVVGNLRTTYDPSMFPLQRLLWHLLQEKRVTRHRRPNIEPEKERFGTAIQMMEILRSNEVLAITLDAPVATEERARAVPVDFLGRQIMLIPGSVSVAQLTSAPLLTMVVHRLKNWRHQVLEISPPVKLGDDPVEAFKRCMAAIEAPIRQNLAYWDFWGGTQPLIYLGLLAADEHWDDVVNQVYGLSF